MFTKTRRECIPPGSRAVSPLLTVLVNMFVSYTKPSLMALGVAEIGTTTQNAPLPHFLSTEHVGESRG